MTLLTMLGGKHCAALPPLMQRPNLEHNVCLQMLLVKLGVSQSEM